MHPRHRRRRSYATIVLVCLLLVGRLSAELHLASVQHAMCAQHGELVEVGAHAHAPDHVPSGDVATTEEAEGARVAPRPSHGDHDHCAVAELARERVLRLELVRAVAHATSAGAALREPPRVALAPSIPRFLIAPKQSPPAV